MPPFCAAVVVSVLALQVHYMDPGAAPPCAVTEKFDCGAVNHSRFAVFPPTSFDEDPAAKHVHVLIAMLGIIGYGLLLVLAALGEEGLWDNLVWHDHSQFFGDAGVDLGRWALTLVVPLLAVPQGVHYLLDAFVWRVGPQNPELGRYLRVG